MNHFFMAGRIEKITKSGGKRQAEGGKPPSAIVLLQYGPSRESGNGPVEFINASLIRIPAFRFEKIADKLEVGSIVAIAGHVQGIVKKVMEESYLTNELVADNVRVGALDFLFEEEEEVE